MGNFSGLSQKLIVLKFVIRLDCLPFDEKGKKQPGGKMQSHEGGKEEFKISTLKRILIGLVFCL